MPGSELVFPQSLINRLPTAAMSLLLNCKQTHQLVSQGLDRPLTFSERAKVKLHLGICESCSNFSGQMTLLRKAMHHYSEGKTGSDEEPEK
jgi:predicted anti-sigma-YlaC factor YlaD